VSSGYRFDFTGLQRRTERDGNFALLTAALEPPTGEKEAPPFQGPFNGIVAAMVAFEWRSVSAVAIGYYRVNGVDNTGSNRGNNWLAGLGFAWTPIDTRGHMLSFQLGLAAEVHDRDQDHHAEVASSGGWELFASPTIVVAPVERLRIFALVSLPFAQDYRASADRDDWRAGLGIIYSLWDTATVPALPPAR
jgi:hypothetical protein